MNELSQALAVVYFDQKTGVVLTFNGQNQSKRFANHRFFMKFTKKGEIYRKKMKKGIFVAIFIVWEHF